MRAGTENILGILGMGKAIELVLQNFEEDSANIIGIKKYAIDKLSQAFSDIVFLGRSGDLEKSLFTVLNIGFPQDGATGMLTFSLDMKKIAASGGSACNSGSNQGSHVIRALGPDFASYVPCRISFSKFNTKEDIDAFVQAIKEIRA